MCKSRFAVEINCSHPDWYRYRLEYAFTPYSDPDLQREVVHYTHPDLDRYLKFTVDGLREWILFGIRLCEPPPPDTDPLLIDVKVFCDGHLVRQLRHEAADLYRTVSGAHVYYASNYVGYPGSRIEK